MLYVEKLGVVMWSPSNPTTGASQMMVYDRDQSGTAVTNHWAGAFAKLDFDNIHATQGRCPGLRPNSGDPNNSCSPSGDATAPSYGGPSDTAAADNNMTWGNTVPLDASRDDGYSDGTLSLQGVRAYDPNMNQWTTPDAYSGRVNDPMSQHPYMWNDNNPVQYADPSGYDPAAAVLPLQIGGAIAGGIVCPECVGFGILMGLAGGLSLSQHGADEKQPAAEPHPEPAPAPDGGERSIGGFTPTSYGEGRLQGSRGDGGVSDEAAESALKEKPTRQANGRDIYKGADATVVTEGKSLVTAWPTSSKGTRIKPPGKPKSR